MIVNVNGKDYSFKTEWKEFTYSDYCSVLRNANKSVSERISNHTGISLDLVNKMSFSQYAFTCDALKFLDETDDALLFIPGYKDDLNIGRRTYKELEECLIFIRKVDNPILAIDKVIKILYSEDISDKNITECLGKGFFILDLIGKFLTEFKRLGDYTPSVEEEEAGVDELSKFGFFATAVQLARKYGKTHDEILAMPAREVYTTLLYDFEQSEVEKRLHEIRSRKK